MQRRLAAILAADIAGYSRLMGDDEAGTHAALQSHRGELIEPAVRKRSGRIVKLTGDGFLAEFGSVVAAIECAAEIQREMTKRNRPVARDRQLMFRIGLHVGEVIVEQDDIYGDGVNIAARLEGVAEPGGVCISRQAFEQIDGKLPLTFRAIGPQQLKNIRKPIEVFALERDTDAVEEAGNLRQQVHYCRAPDGVRLAWATVGHGPPLLKTANWLNHLELEWGSPVWRHVLLRLAADYTLVRYDQRGMGLSDWEAADLSLEARVADLEAVVDAAGIERFPLLGISQGCAVSIAYAARHPQRVSHLVLYGGFAVGYLRRSSNEAERFTALKTLMRQGWGGESSPRCSYRAAARNRSTGSTSCNARARRRKLLRACSRPRPRPTLSICWRASACRRWSCTPAAMPEFRLSSGSRWRREFPVPASSRSRAATTCSWKASRPPTGFSRS
jgi:class 3 adenylate cyclase/pimeloyl-ACP methyl ester carboxylesterase